MALVSKIYGSLTCLPCFAQHLRCQKGAISIYITNIQKILIPIFLQFQPFVCWYIYFMKQNSRQVSNTSTFFKNDCVSEYILCQMTQLYYLVMYVGQVQNKVFMTQFYAYHCILECKINTNTHISRKLDLLQKSIRIHKNLVHTYIYFQMVLPISQCMKIHFSFNFFHFSTPCIQYIHIPVTIHCTYVLHNIRRYVHFVLKKSQGGNEH